MITRKSAFAPNASKAHETFKRACKKLIKSGEYTPFVNWHTAMGRYRMHTMGYEGNVGMWRFLAWHRIYLLRFEAALRRHEPTAYIPYWKWTKSHMELNPKFYPPAPVKVERMSFLRGARITQDYIDNILSADNFKIFSFRLETGPHDRIHNSFRRGTMNQDESG